MSFSDFCSVQYVRRAPLGSQTKCIHAFFKSVGGTYFPDMAYAKKIFSGPNLLSQDILSSFPETLPRESLETFLRACITNTAGGSAGLVSRWVVPAKAGRPTTLDIDLDAFILALADWFKAVFKKFEECDILAAAYQRLLEGESDPEPSSFTTLYAGDKMILPKPPSQQDYSEPFWSKFSHEWGLQSLGTANWIGRSVVCTYPKDNGVHSNSTRIPVPITPPSEFARTKCHFETWGREGKAISQWTLINDNDQNYFPNQGESFDVVVTVVNIDAPKREVK